MNKIVSLLLVLVILQCCFSFTEASKGCHVPKKYKCKASERNVDACAEIYQPVCGHNPYIRCIRAPCPQFEQFGNRCEACKNENIDYIYYGKCKSLYHL